MICREEILKSQECPKEYENNLSELLKALNMFRDAYGKPMVVTSGYRSPKHNEEIGGATNSSHLFCRAADILDQNRDLQQFCLSNVALLEKCGIWCEDFNYTPKKGSNQSPWVHMSSRPASKRFFIP